MSKCSACKAHIPDEGGDNELLITLTGGYGRFFDTDFTEKHPGYYDLRLCHECAHKLVHSSPFLTHLLRGGHFHDFIYNLHGEFDDLRSVKGEPECITDFNRDWGAL